MLSVPRHLPCSLFSNFSRLKSSTAPATATTITTSNRKRLTKSACLSLIQACSSMAHLKQIHCQIFTSNLHHSKDIVNDLMHFCTHPKLGDLTYASSLLHTTASPPLFLFNLLINALSKKHRFTEVLAQFNLLRRRGLSPDNYTYPFVLKSVAGLKSMPRAMSLHAHVVKSGNELDTYIRNSLIDMYGGLGCAGVARFLFEEMPNRDVITWSALIAGYVRCGEFETAVSAFEMMEGEGVRPNEATLVSTLSACTELRNLELGKRIHRYMEEEYRFGVPIENALLGLYAKCGSFDTARSLFDAMPERSVISWTAMVSGYVSSARLNDARELFDLSPVRDVVLWTVMINGYVQYNQYEEALALFKEMQRERIKPDKFTVVALLTVCSNLGALEQGKWIHGYIEENMIQNDIVVSTALIDMYAKCGWIEKSMEIFRKVEGRKDTAIWSSIICGLAMNGRAQTALELFEEMKEVGVEPDDITFVGVLSACGHGGLVDEGRQHFYSMGGVHRIEPKVEHYGCLIDLLGRAGLIEEAEELIGKMKDAGDSDVLPLWGALLGACRIHGNVKMGERLARKVNELESESSGLHTLIANIYADASRWEDVNRVRRKMKDLGIKKVPGCSSIEVDGVIREFLVRDSSHPESGGIYSVLNSMSRVMESERILDTEEILVEIDS